MKTDSNTPAIVQQTNNGTANDELRKKEILKKLEFIIETIDQIMRNTSYILFDESYYKIKYEDEDDFIENKIFGKLPNNIYKILQKCESNLDPYLIEICISTNYKFLVIMTGFVHVFSDENRNNEEFREIFESKGRNIDEKTDINFYIAVDKNTEKIALINQYDIYELDDAYRYELDDKVKKLKNIILKKFEEKEKCESSFLGMIKKKFFK